MPTNTKPLFYRADNSAENVATAAVMACRPSWPQRSATSALPPKAINHHHWSHTMQTGTIIHGTLRRQDLIPAFLAALRSRAPHALTETMRDAERAVGMADSDPWWDSDEAADVLDGLTTELNEHAPDGHYFGTHPGDGADFGFWPCEDF